MEINSAVADDQTAAVPRPFRMSRWLSAAVREARPRQWLKNLLVFAAPLAGATTGRPGGLAYAGAAFLAFGCASASVYYVNDIIDAERDRRHPVKCSRPIASGDLPVRDAIVIAATLAFLAAGSGFAIGAPLLSAVTGGYLVSSTFYSARGKHVPYLEMLLVASGFVLRVLAGAVATRVPPSPWFLGVCSLGALSVAVAKRYTELTSLGAEAVRHRPVTRFYRAATLRAIQVTLAAGMVATYVTWAASQATGARYWHVASALPLTLALLRFGMLTGRRTVRPVEDILTRDRLMLACEVTWLALFTVGVYLDCRQRPDIPSHRSGRHAAIRWLSVSESGEETRVPYVDSGEARIWYVVQGTGFPMLTLAPGGMRSSVPLWEMAAINPLTAYAGQYQMIAMDQRNAGRSAGPLEAGDPWGAYAADQLAVMDHLGIGRFLVFGCCIGGPFILKLCELAPERVVAAVLEQPVGIIASNRELFDTMWKQWGEQLLGKRDDLGSDEVEAFATTMWGPDFAVSVTRDQVRSFRTPMLILPGVDEYHPAQTGREIAALAPAAELLEPWKDPGHLPAATEAVGRFLRDHTPR